MIVYALSAPRDGRVRSTGKTHRSAQRRLRRHRPPCYLRGETHKERWLRALLQLDLEPRIVELATCLTADELNAAERRLIAEYRAAGVDLTNATDGGDGVGFAHAPETKAKISAALTGKPKSPEHRARAANAARGRYVSDETRQRQSDMRLGRPGRVFDDAERVRMSRAKNGRPFVDQHGNRYETQKGAARMLGINIGHLNDVLHGKRAHTKGLVFRFVHDLRVQQFPEVTHE